MPDYFYKLLFTNKFYAIRIISVLLILSGCGYHAGSHSERAFPSVAEKRPSRQTLVAIPLFSNTTPEPLLEKQMTQVFKETLSRRGWRIEENKKKAMLTLSGRITGFRRTPISLTLLGAAREYRLQIGLEIRLLRPEYGKEERLHLLQGFAEYSVQPDAGRDRIAKERAIREAGQKMAEEITSLLLMPTVEKEAGTVRE